MSAEEYLRRRKQEVAKAVEETRKRLTSLGWKTNEKKLTVNIASKPPSGPGGIDVKLSSSKANTTNQENKNNAINLNSKTIPDSTSKDNSQPTSSAAIVKLSSDDGKENSSEKSSVGGHVTKEEKSSTVSLSKDKVLDNIKDTNKCASKENSQESSPEVNKSNVKDPKADASRMKTVDSTSGESNNRVLDTVNGQANDPNTPEITIRTSPSSEDSSSCDLDSEMDSNKENMSSVSMLNKKTSGGSGGGSGSKSRSGGERSKVSSKEGKKTNMRRVSSLNDLRKQSLDKNEASPLLTQPNQSHVRSSSMECEKRTTVSPAKQKKRADRILPLLPTPKTRSYEARTESSMAKVVRRINDSPPSSPNAVRRKKISITGSTKPGPMKAMDPSLIPNSSETSTSKAESVSNQEISHDAGESSSSTKQLNAPDEPKNNRDRSPQTATRETADKLAMPPPSTTHVSKSKTNRKSSISKISDRGRKRSSSITSSEKGRRASTSSLPPPSFSDTNSKVIVNGKGCKGQNTKPSSTSSEKVESSTPVNKPESSLAPRSLNVVPDPAEDEDKTSSSVSEDTMVSETAKLAANSELHQGENSKQEDANTDGGASSEENKIMQSDLRIDLADITVGDLEQDPGHSLRQSVDVMKTAFEQCIQYVTMIQKKGNHRQDLQYFDSAFNAMDRSFAKVRPVTQRSGNLSPDNTLSDVSEGFLNNDTPGMSDSARSLPALSSSEIMSLSLGRGQLDGKTKSLDESPPALALLQHYSDMLVSLVRTKMEEGDEPFTSGRSRVSSADLDTDE